jgi:hypothetical protein
MGPIWGSMRCSPLDSVQVGILGDNEALMDWDHFGNIGKR